MENTNRPAIRSDADRQYWRTVHSHTRYIYEAIEDRLLRPSDHPQQVAYEALGIVHAMSHLALQEDQPLAVGLCPVELAPEHLAAAQVPPKPLEEVPE